MQRPPLKSAHARPAGRNPSGTALRQLGWPHYWLLVSILGSGLLFFVLILMMVFPGR